MYNRKEELEKIKSLDIVLFLQQCGFKPTSNHYGKAWFLSPLRKENNPSFCVYLNKRYHDWYDYGANIGGSIIDLVMHLFEMDYIESIKMLRKTINYKE